MELHCIEIKLIFVNTILHNEQKIYIIIKGVLLMNVMSLILIKKFGNR